MFVKGVCKYIFIFCLFENEKKKKKLWRIIIEVGII